MYNNKLKSFQMSINLHWYFLLDSPTIVVSPPKRIELKPFDTITINCTAMGIPTPEIVWRLNWGCVPQKCTMTSIEKVMSLKMIFFNANQMTIRIAKSLLLHLNLAWTSGIWRFDMPTCPRIRPRCILMWSNQQQRILFCRIIWLWSAGTGTQSSKFWYPIL